MIVIADSSPINILVRIDRVEVLPRLFGEVVIPDAVQMELESSRTPEVVRSFMSTRPPWLVLRAASGAPRLPGIDAGESAAIQLALQESDSILVMDDWDGRRLARSKGLRVVGTIGVLEQAAVAGLVDLPQCIEMIKQTDFRMSNLLFEEALARDAERKRGPTA
jgi:predicted nucleic acid-binding protein